ncbi:MAG: insulinase family protein [Spirochaetes bacterium]|nr:insulinase family protein [Spirochaetota bacterium]
MFEKVVLPNGIRIVGERLPSLDVVSIGFWFDVGSADESIDVNGYTHFIEHMLFKGTRRYSAYDIVKTIEGVGGNFNAFTSRQFTAFYVSIPSPHVDRALDILIDIMESSMFDSKEIEKEKRVIIEEIKMSNDSPEEIVSQQFFSKFYAKHPMALPIAGTAATVRRIDRGRLVSYFRRMFTAKNLIVSAAGKFNMNNFVKRIARMNIPTGTVSAKSEPPQAHYGLHTTVKKDLNQVYFCLVHEGYVAGDPRNYPLTVVNNMLGGGSSSRLFQSLREKNALCYNIYTYSSTYKDTGTFEIHAATGINNYARSLELIYEELIKLKHKELSEEEIQEAKEMYRGALAFNKMNPDFIMNKNAKHEFYYGRYYTFNEMYRFISSVKAKDVHGVIDTVFGAMRFFLSAVGPSGTDAITRKSGSAFSPQ